ncbi:unnamed protein product [Leuciscus chuanchicus]
MAACSLLYTPSSSLLPFLSLTGAASAIPVQPPAPQVSPQARALPLTVDQPLVASLVPPSCARSLGGIVHDLNGRDGNGRRCTDHKLTSTPLFSLSLLSFCSGE